MSIGKSSTGKVKITDGNDDVEVTANALHVNLRDSSGTERGTLANPIYVNSSATGGSTDVKIFDSSGDAIQNGQQTMANSVPVTLASDQTAVPISDNGGSITVDGTVTANAGTGTFAVSAASLPLPTGAATESTLASLDSKVVSYTEGDVDTSITGFAILGEEAATNTLKTISSKQLGTQVTSSDNGLVANVVIHGLSSAGGGSFVDVKVNPSGTLEVSANQATHDNLNANANIQVNNTDVGNANPVPVSDAGGSLTVDGTVTANAGSGTFAVSAASLPLPAGASTLAEQQSQTTLLGTIDADTSNISTKINTIAGAVSGTEMQVDVLTMPTTTVQATNLDIRDLSSASDSVTVHGDVGVIDQLDLTNSNPAVVAIVDANGDQITSFGGGTQYADGASAATPTGNQINWNESGTQRAASLSKPLPVQPGTGIAFPVTDNGGSLTVDGTVTASNASGDVAHDSADSGNPIKIGSKAKNYGSLPTAVADGDRTDLRSDRYGAPFVQPGSSYVRCYNAEYTADQTNTAMLTAGASESIRVYGITISYDYDAQSSLSMAIGFGTASVPANDSCLFESGGMVPGIYPIMFPVAIAGAANEDLRITTTGYSTGNINIQIIYDIISI